MDYGYLEHMLKTIEKTEVSIKGTAQYCNLHNSSAELITGLVKEHLERARKDKKILYMYIIHETLLESKKKTHMEFIQCYGNNLTEIVKHLSNQLEKYDDIKELKSLINMWGKQEIFVKTFIDKLNSIILPTYKKLYTEQLNYTQKKDEKYSEQFIRSYRTVQESELGRKVYNTIYEFSKVQKNIDQFYQQAIEFKPETDLNNQANLDKLEQTIDAAKRYKDELMNKIIELQKCYQEVSNMCENELIDYTRRKQDNKI